MALRAYSALLARPATARPPLIQMTCRTLHGPGRRPEDEYSDVPLYPPIPKLSKGSKEHKAEKVKQMVRKLGTVEEKQWMINKPKYYGWYSYHLWQHNVPCDAKEFLQFATQTHIVDGSLPGYYSAPDPRAGKLTEELGPVVERVILDHLLHTQHGFTVPTDRVPLREIGAVHWPEGRQAKLQEKLSKSLIKRIHATVLAKLAKEVDHLRDCSEDISSRNEAFWFRGGIEPDKSMLRKREGTQKMQQQLRDKGLRVGGTSGDDQGRWPVMSDEQVMEPYQRCMQYLGQNLVQLRSHLPLPAFLDREDPLVTQSEVPVLPHDPRVWGYKAVCRHGTNVPGCWPDADHQHGLLMLNHRHNVWETRAVGGPFTEEAQRAGLAGTAILSCFGWTLAQATHLGFSPVTELTFPLASQAALTDGRMWTYAAYQLNTVDLTNNQPGSHSHNNVLWLDKDRALYTKVEDGKLLGFDPAVLEPLVRMYLRQPQPREHSLTPYLAEHKTVSRYHEPYQRNNLQKQFKHMYSNRPRHYAKPEMYLWEKIHLVDHKGIMAARLGNRRRRWFQMAKVAHSGREHWHPEFMEVKENNPPYVPKAMRKEDYMRKKGLGRRYNKYLPKLTVPLEETAAIYKLPETKYKPED